jgi:hypothetical protein
MLSMHAAVPAARCHDVQPAVVVMTGLGPERKSATIFWTPCTNRENFSEDRLKIVQGCPLSASATAPFTNTSNTQEAICPIPGSGVTTVLASGLSLLVREQILKILQGGAMH